jgi:predicted DNA-binding mobile mystery protein A
MNKGMLQLQQLNNKMSEFKALKSVNKPSFGWIKAIRTSLGMTMQQLGNRLNISKQAVLDIEKREKEGSITIKSMVEISKVLEMEFVYGFVPNDGSLDSLIEKRANQLAQQSVMRTAQTMQIEDQSPSKERIKEAIKERANMLKKEMPKMLWD